MSAPAKTATQRWFQFNIRSTLLLLTLVALSSLLFKGWLRENDTPLVSSGNTLLLEIAADGSVHSGTEAISDEELFAAIAATAETIESRGGDPEVMFWVAPSVKHHRVVEVLDLVADANISEVKFGVRDTNNNPQANVDQNGVTTP